MIVSWTPPLSGMLALQGACLRRHALKPARHSNLANRRYFVQGLCDGFIDLALALPIPPSLPPYSSTIILVTIVTRLALLPISIWVCFSNQILLLTLMLQPGKGTNKKGGGNRNAWNRATQTSCVKTCFWRDENIEDSWGQKVPAKISCWQVYWAGVSLLNSKHMYKFTIKYCSWLCDGRSFSSSTNAVHCLPSLSHLWLSSPSSLASQLFCRGSQLTQHHSILKVSSHCQP